MLLDAFAGAFCLADHVVVTGIYPARETDTLDVSGADIVERMEHPDVQYAETLGDAVRVLLQRIKPGDIVITLGAGDGYLIGERLLAELEGRETCQ
jgi:UDP-N-acetylmuramate--alanine ligase